MRREMILDAILVTIAESRVETQGAAVEGQGAEGGETTTTIPMNIRLLRHPGQAGGNIMRLRLVERITTDDRMSARHVTLDR